MAKFLRYVLKEVLLLPLFSQKWDDIVFLSRNKSYGAYELRRLSSKYALWSLITTIFSFTIFILFLQFSSPKESKPPEFEFEKMLEFKGFDANLVSVQPIKKEQAPSPSKTEEVDTPEEKKEDLPPKVVEDNLVKEARDLPSVIDTSIKKKDKEGNDSVKEFQAGADSGITLVKYEEGQASYYGGITEFNKWVSMNLRCPREVIESMMIQATVEVFFIIDVEGAVTNVRVLKGFNSDCDKEVARVIQLSPKWKPRVVNGIPVPQRYKVGILINPAYYKNLNQYK